MNRTSSVSKANFASKSKLLKWINGFFQPNPPVQELEDFVSGALFCQILDSIYPDVPLYKVSFYAQTDTEINNNYKIMQKIFLDNKIQKRIDYEKLRQGKYQDILSFLQYLKSVFDTEADVSTYDAVKRRDDAIQRFYKAKGTKVPPPPQPKPKADAKKDDSDDEDGAASNQAPAAAGNTAANPTASRLPPKSPRIKRDHASRLKQNTVIDVLDPSLDGKAREVASLLEKLFFTIEGLEKERDFFYEKLQGVENICTDERLDSPEKVKKVLDILYFEENPDLPLEDNDDLRRSDSDLRVDDHQKEPEEPLSQPAHMLFGDVPIKKEDEEEPTF